MKYLYFKAAILLTAMLVIAGCNGMQEKIQKKVDGNILSATVGKSYSKYAAQRKTNLEGLFADDRAYGEIFAASKFQNDDVLYRHLDRYESSESNSNFGSLISKQEIQYSYRLLYFRVDHSGIIRDYANGFLGGETSTCVGWIRGIFQKCKNDEILALAVVQYDQIVQTSSGLPLSSWPLLETTP